MSIISLPVAQVEAEAAQSIKLEDQDTADIRLQALLVMLL